MAISRAKFRTYVMVAMMTPLALAVLGVIVLGRFDSRPRVSLSETQLEMVYCAGLLTLSKDFDARALSPKGYDVLHDRLWAAVLDLTPELNRDRVTRLRRDWIDANRHDVAELLKSPNTALQVALGECENMAARPEGKEPVSE